MEVLKQQNEELKKGSNTGGPSQEDADAWEIERKLLREKIKQLEADNASLQGRGLGFRGLGFRGRT